MENNTRNRKWFITVNNPDKLGLEQVEVRRRLEKEEGLIYACGSDEIGEEGTYHSHIFTYHKQAKRFSQMKELFPGAHLEEGKGTPKHARDYIAAEGEHKKKAHTSVPGTFYEIGECPAGGSGKRTDLAKVLGQLESGKSALDLVRESPQLISQMNNLDKIAERIAEERGRAELRDIYVTYNYGDAGTGKTHGVYLQHGIENVFTVNNYKNPWDTYKGQDVVMLEEYWNQLEFTFMLALLDKYPLMLPSRYNDKRAQYTQVCINSNIPPQLLYKNIQREYPKSFAAFIRRIHWVNEYSRNGQVDEGGHVIPQGYTMQKYAEIFMKHNPAVMGLYA